MKSDCTCSKNMISKLENLASLFPFSYDSKHRCLNDSMHRRKILQSRFYSVLSHNTAPKQHHVYPSTTRNDDAPQPYRQAQRSSGIYYQLTKSTLPNSSKEQPEPHQEVSEDYEFPSKIFQGSSSGLEHLPYTAVSQRAIHKFSPQQWRSSNNKIGTPQTTNSSKEQPEPHQEASEDYEFPSEIFQGSSSGLEHLPYTAVSQRAIHKFSPQQCRSSNNKIGAPQTTNSSKEQPEPHQEASENTSFRRSKTYFEELSSGSASSSGSESFTQYDQNQKSIDSLKTQSPSSSSTSMTKNSKGSTAVSKDITSSITTITTEKKTEVKSTNPAADYGETDWYLDLLLRMQALEMKQQNLHVQIDFLGNLTNENKENLKEARDWARYDADNYQVQAY